MVVAEDRSLEVLKRFARVESERLDECGPGLFVRRERVRLPARAVERHHEQPAQVFVQRLLTHERLELRHSLGMAAEGEVGFKAMLERDKPQVFESGDLVADEVLVAKLCERWPAPEHKRLAEHLSGFVRVAVGEQTPAAFEQALEPVDVERFGLQPKQVASQGCVSSKPWSSPLRNCET